MVCMSSKPRMERWRGVFSSSVNRDEVAGRAACRLGGNTESCGNRAESLIGGLSACVTEIRGSGRFGHS